MANENNFKNIADVYNRVLPAINTKIDELNRLHIKVRNIDIWDYCVKYIWNKKGDLRMYEMVSDILNIDEIKLIEFINNRHGDENERQ